MVADPIICCCMSDLKPENVLLKNEALIDWIEANLDEKTAVEIRKEQLVAGVHRADGKAYDVVEKWKATHHTPVMQKMTQKMQKEMQNMQRASGSTGSGA